MYIVLMLLGRQIHTAGPLVTGPRAFEVESAIEKLKRCKLSGIDQIMVELAHVNSISNKEEQPQQ
jgi:3-deoxy-D-arabino-heptulosonate 7-phosphate (DAHP) synthase